MEFEKNRPHTCAGSSLVISFLGEVIYEIFHKLNCGFEIILTMATPIFPQVKDKITIFTACDEDMIF